jgi:hypothetical protein
MSGDDSYDIINTTIQKYFNNYKIITKIPRKLYHINIECSSTLNTDFTINIRDSLIYIYLINAPCNGLTGKKIVRKIITIANDLKITNIELQDQSYIHFKDEKDELNCSIKLAPLNIILKGQNWYNTMGFVYDDFEKDKKDNADLLNKSTTDFLIFVESIVGDLEEYDEDYIRLKAFKELIKDKDHTTSFKELFKEIYNEENKNPDKCSKNLVIIYNFLLFLISFEILKYDRFLKYDVDYDIDLKKGGRRKKTCLRRSKTKKIRRRPAARKNISSHKRRKTQ